MKRVINVKIGLVSFVITSLVLLNINGGLSIVKAQELTEREATVCEQLMVRQAAINTRLAQQDKAILQGRTLREEKLKNSEIRLDEVLRARRERNATQRIKAIESLNKITASKEAYDAIETYRKAVDAAVETRQAAFDDARQQYQDSLKHLIEARHTELQMALTAYKTAIDEAFTKASARCEDRSDKGIVRSELIRDLQAARLSFRSEKVARANISASVKQLVEERKTAHKTATAAFEAAMKQARDELRLVLY